MDAETRVARAQAFCALWHQYSRSLAYRGLREPDRSERLRLLQLALEARRRAVRVVAESAAMPLEIPSCPTRR